MPPLASKPWPVVNVKDYGATGDSTTDDTTAIQAAINACATGGCVFLPVGIYKITAALTITKHLTLQGESLTYDYSDHAASGTNGPQFPSSFKGAVIRQDTAATDAIKLTGSGQSVNLRDFGINFGNSIRNSNTGHGINAQATATYSSGTESGVMDFDWSNVGVSGVDGNHYAFRLVNPILGTLKKLRGFGGGGVYVGCDSYYTNYGNLTFDHPYMWVFNAGTAHGFALASRQGRGAAQGLLNLMTFLRPQCNVTNAAAAAGAQSAWTSTAGAALPQAIDVISPDMEITAGSTWTGGGSSGFIDFGGPQSGTIVRRGGTLTNDPAGGYSTDHGYRVYTTSGTFVVPNGVTQIRMRLIGGGGGGGGAGSASSNIAQGGGGGGGAAAVIDTAHTVISGGSYAFTVGTAGTAGTGGASGGNTGSSGSQGGSTTFDGVTAQGGGGGGLSAANSVSNGNGGWFSRTGSISNSNQPGFGGNGGNGGAGISAVPMPPGVAGGGGGGSSATTTNGGNGGSAATSNPPGTTVGGGSQGGSGTTAGVNGTTALQPGCGGGGGGGGANGGKGGDGGNGGPGQLEIWW